jgi:hypothetical protein
MRQRTPQEKKALSLRRDRRNVYGESPHGARKTIPHRKKLRNRANRHQEESKLPSAPVPFEQEQAEEIESSVRRKAPKRWDKVPDAALGSVIAVHHQRRSDSHGRKVRSKADLAFRDGRFRGECPTCGIGVYVLVGRHRGEHYGAFCAVGQGSPDPKFPKVNIRPCRPSELPEVARELHSLCVDSPEPWFGEWVRRLFGRATCPQCCKPFDVAEVVAASDGIRRVCSASGRPRASSPPEWLGRLRHWLYLQP